ncbi:MAG TPA: NTP transferase domain-containing protein [candidate division Zixibacteria bacterium]|nr:NTP transferase domain-containing protein [candidate division Zixibacteria bacterium]
MAEHKAAVVLAAGKGKRMESDLPKVLHRIHGRPMIAILLDTLKAMDFDRLIVVIGFKGELVQKELADYPVEFAWQREQLGTGHAVMMAREQLEDFEGTTLVALGDVPFLSADTISRLFEVHSRTGAKATCLSAIVDDPKGYGRIIRDGDSDRLKGIVEHKDASEQVLKITEINTGTFCFDNRLLFESLNQIDNDNAQGEYYLPDCVKVLYNKGLRVSVVTAPDADEGLGVNDVDQLDQLAKKFSRK